MTFDDKPYLLDIYADHAQQLVFQKCVQVFATEWAIIEALSQAELGRSVFYVVPKYLLRNSFVKNRISRSFQHVKYYRDMKSQAIGTSDSMSMIHYGDGVIFFASSETPSDFDMFNADVAIIDDLHNCAPDNIAFTDDRLSASQHKIKRQIGVANIPERGINEQFLLSDQKEWHVKCGSCGEYQILDFFQHVCRKDEGGLYQLLDKEWQPNDFRDIELYCEHCGKSTDRLGMGVWEAMASSNISGYHLSKIFTPTTTISELWDKLQRGITKRNLFQNFMNRDLGLPYVDADFQMDMSILDRCCDDFALQQTCDVDCFMGVDVGNHLHVRISEWKEERRYARFIGTVPRFEDLDALMKRYNVKGCVIDARPEIRMAISFQEKYNKGIVWRCEYPNWSVENQSQKVKTIRKSGIVQVDRTQHLDDVMSSYLTGETRLPKNARGIPDFYDQMKASQRIQEDRAGKPAYIWVNDKADHYYHADAYEMLAKVVCRKREYMRFM